MFGLCCKTYLSENIGNKSDIGIAFFVSEPTYIEVGFRELSLAPECDESNFIRSADRKVLRIHRIFFRIMRPDANIIIERDGTNLL